jgi:hypothetical protein
MATTRRIPVEGFAHEPLIVKLAAVDDAAQGFDFFAQVVGQVGAAARDITDPITDFADLLFGSVGPIAQSIFGIVEAALQIATHLLAGFGSEQKAGQGPGAQSDQQERNCRTDIAAI